MLSIVLCFAVMITFNMTVHADDINKESIYTLAATATPNVTGDAYMLSLNSIDDEFNQYVSEVRFEVTCGKKTIIYNAICKDVSGNYLALLKIKDFAQAGDYSVRAVAELNNGSVMNLKPTVFHVDSYKETDKKTTTVSVLGDSISTYLGVTSDDSTGCYYTPDNFELDDMWWNVLCARNNMQLGVVNAIGGSRVTWNGVDDDQSYHLGEQYAMTYDGRIQSLDDNGKPDIICFFGGMNDALAGNNDDGTPKVTIGDLNQMLTYGKLDTFADAYMTALLKLNYYYPEAEIISISPYQTVGDLVYGDVTTPIAKSIAKCDSLLGNKNVDLRSSGIMGNVDTQSDSIHLTASGMVKVVQMVESALGLNPNFSSGFRKDWRGQEHYYDADGDMLVNRFVNVNNSKYYINNEGVVSKNTFACDGKYTYYFQADGTAMTDRLTYHPDGQHVIYFDEKGHEVFSNYAHVRKSISGDTVDDYCFFDVNGYMYTDVLTWDEAGENLLYANPYGVLEVGKWFQFSDTLKWADGTQAEGIAGKYGYANADATLMRDTYTYDWDGRLCYMQGNGTALYK